MKKFSALFLAVLMFLTLSLPAYAAQEAAPADAPAAEAGDTVAAAPAEVETPAEEPAADGEAAPEAPAEDPEAPEAPGEEEPEPTPAAEAPEEAGEEPAEESAEEPAADGDAAQTPYEIARSMDGQPFSELKALLGEPYAVQEFDEPWPIGTVNRRYRMSGVYVWTTQPAGGTEIITSASDVVKVYFYESAESTEPALVRESLRGDSLDLEPDTCVFQGRPVKKWVTTEGNLPQELTEDVHVYPVYPEREEGCWQVCFLDEEGNDFLKAVNVPVGQRLTEGLFQGYYFYTGPNKTGTKLEDLTALDITGDTIIYVGKDYAAYVYFLREDGQSMLAYSGGVLCDPGDEDSLSGGYFFSHWTDADGQRHSERVTVLGWKDAEGNLLTSLEYKDGRYTMEEYSCTYGYEPQFFYAVEGIGVLYYSNPGTITTMIGEEYVEKGELLTQAPTEYGQRPIVGWTDESGAPVDISKPLTSSKILDAIQGWYLTIRDGDSGAVIQTEAVADQSKAGDVELPASYQGKTITGWHQNYGAFVDPAEVTITQHSSLCAWFGLRLPADDGKAYINGMGGDIFAPQDSLTRAQAANILYKLLGVTEKGESPCVFTDVSSGAWYYDAVTVLASHGILTGYADSDTGTYYFRPNQSVTRAEFVTMLGRLFPPTSGAGQNFSDVRTGDWYWDEVGLASFNGWVTGYEQPDGSYAFVPNSSITRAEAVTIVNRVLGRSLTEAEAEAMTMPFTDVPAGYWAYDQVLAAAAVLG